MRVRHALLGGWLVGLCMLAGCVTPPQIISGVDSVTDAAQLQSWQARGRLGVSAEQSGSGGFIWSQQQERSEVQVRGPAGIGAMTLTLQGDQLSIQTSDGAQHNAAAALDELQLRLGAPLPIRSLRYWLLGLAAPGAAQWDAARTQLVQDGWSVAYEAWATRQSLRLPQRLTLSRDEIRVRIVVQSWELQP